MTPGLTADARAALSRAGFSRRTFLKGSGALVVGFSIAELADALGYVAAQGINGAGASQLDSWVAIGGDGRITAYTGKCELGQGMLTAQTQLVAEELSVLMDRVAIIQCDTSVTPDQGTTSGSQSHPANFNHANLALACATAREALIQMASARLSVPGVQLIARDGVVSVRTDASKRVTYGELVGGRRFSLPLNTNAKRKPSNEWTVLGTPAKRVDIPALVAGTAEFVHTLRVPGMLHGRVVRPPAVGATLTSVDESSISGMPGFVKVVRKINFLGVVFEKPWQAIQGATRLKAAWSSGVTLPPQATFYEYLRKQPARDTLSVNSGDVDAMLQKAAQPLRATYYHPYQMHASIGSSCAVADVQAGRATIWSSTQSVYPLRSTTAMILGLQPANVRVIFVRGSGCYGINGADTVSFDAALMSQAVGRPVRVQLSRKDEMAWENYGFAYTINQRAVIDASGTIVAWDYENWYAGMGGRPGANAPGNVITGMLAGLQPQPFTPRTPAPEPTGAFNNGSNVVPSYVTGTIGGVSGGTGTVAGQRVLTHVSRSYFPTGPLRSPSRLQNTFAHESFMDEIASQAKADPVAYRLRHLRDPRLRDVVSAAARGANWDARPSPKPGIRRTGIATGRGMACVLYEGDNGYAAMVAEVEVNQDTGRVVVKRMVISSDCGPISNPDGLRNQMEGGALQGLSRAMGEAVTWDEHAVTSVDWRTYPTLYVGSALPTIEHVLINRPDGEAMGAGETSITIVAAAVGNAIFDATGARLREVPFTPDRLKAALAARSTLR